MTTDVTTRYRCSFCGKQEHEVAKFIAGPGAYICDECVAVCDQILAGEPTRDFPSEDSLSDAALLDKMAAIAASRDQVEDAVKARVQSLRKRGVTWVRIGEVLGISRQSAWERFSTDAD